MSQIEARPLASGPNKMLSMLVTLERVLSNAKLGEEIEALCAEARALITTAAVTRSNRK